MNNKYLIFIYMLLLTIINISDAISNIIKVSNGYKPTIQDAIDISVNGDVILLANENHFITSSINFKGKAVTVASEFSSYSTASNYSPYSCAIISIFNGGPCLIFENGEGNKTKIMNLTIRSARSNGNGGAIYCLNSSPSITNCIIEKNEAILGSGIYCENSSPIIQLSLIYNNNASDSGGGIYLGNKSNPIIYKCTIRENTATNGGGLFSDTSSIIRISAADFFNNKAENGGGMYLQSTKNEILDLLILKNEASINGGGIYIDNASDSKLINCIISQNSSTGNGFGFFIDSSNNTKIINCTIHNNGTNGVGQGPVYMNNTSLKMVNTILSNSNYKEIVETGSNYEVKNSYISKDRTIYPGENNIGGELIFQSTEFDTDIAKWSIPENYYLLTYGSSCIDAGLTDDDTYDRDFNGVVRSRQGNYFDIGACEYEYVKELELSPSTVTGDPPLFVEFRCMVNESKKYTYTIFYGDGSEPESSDEPEFKHSYAGGVYEVYCKVMFRDNIDAFSISEPHTIYVAHPKWIYQTGSEISSSPAIGSDGTIYIGSENGFLYAISQNGQLRWKYLTGGPITGSPAIFKIFSNDNIQDDTKNEIIYIGSEDMNLYAIEADTGNLRWVFPTKGYIYSSPAVDSKGNIYVGSCDHNLYAINSDGTMKWAFFTGDMVISSPSYVYYPTQKKEIVYVGSLDNNLYAINAANGRIEWSFNTGNHVYASPAISTDGTIYIGACNLLGPYQDNKFYAITTNGLKKWEHSIGRGSYSSPAVYFGKEGSVDVGTIFVGSKDNHLYALNLDGSEKWVFPTRYNNNIGSYDINSSPAIGDDGTVYFGSYDNYIYAVNPEKGNVIWSYKTNDKIISSPVLDDNGVLYIGSKDGILYAIQTNSNKPSYDSPWPMYKGNVNHTSNIEFPEQKNMIPTIIKTIPDSNAQNINPNELKNIKLYFSKIMADCDDLLGSGYCDKKNFKIQIYFEKDGNKILALDDTNNDFNFTEEFVDSTLVTCATSNKPLTMIEYDSDYSVIISAKDKKENSLKGNWTLTFSTAPMFPDTESDSGGTRGCFILTSKNAYQNFWEKLYQLKTVFYK